MVFLFTCVAAADSAPKNEVQALSREVQLLRKEIAEIRGREDWSIDLSPICAGRLTLTSGTAITTSDVTGATTIYFTPYGGSKLSLYDGSTWKLFSYTELSLALGTLSSGVNYDVFAYISSGAVALDSPVAWADDTSRATSVVLQDGIYVKSGAATRRYLGTFRTTSTTTTEDSRSRRLVWNNCHRVPRELGTTPSTDNWTYGTNSWRAANGNTTVGQGRVEMLFGLVTEPVELMASAPVQAGSSAGATAGVGITSTTVNSADFYGGVATDKYSGSLAQYIGTPGVGYYYGQWLEWVQAVGTTTFYSNSQSASDARLGGLLGKIWQ